jgi:hypothetical protein
MGKIRSTLRSRHKPYRPRIEILERRLAPATITVDASTDDLQTFGSEEGTVSLREAIVSINNQADINGDVGTDRVGSYTGATGVPDVIHFNIIGSKQINVGAFTLGALPAITEPMIIDGRSQPGFAGTPIVILNGANAGSGANGLDIKVGSVTIKRLVINQFAGNGILIEANNATTGDTITGNYIGTNAAGTAGVGNGQSGVLIDGTNSTSKGLAASNNRIINNVISGNGKDGVLIQAHAGVATGNLLAANLIGTDASGAVALANAGDGVTIDGASGNQIGKAGQFQNVISGNGVEGVHILGTLTLVALNNAVANNFIGTTMSGKTGLGNQLDGVEIAGADSSSISGNVIGGNVFGIELDNGAQSNVIQANAIGVAADLRTAIANTQDGIVLNSSDSLTPPHGPGQANEPGIQNNLIGDPNGQQGNIIAFNRMDGIAIFGNPVSLSGQANIGNRIEANSIFQNGRNNPTFFIGIDLSNQQVFPSADGITPNDSQGHGGADDPNSFQNFPVLSLAVPTLTGGTRIRGSLTQSVSPNTSFRIDFFASNGDPLNGIPEGQFWLGFVSAMTNGSGSVVFDATVSERALLGQVITATATDPTGNTSEFSAGVVMKAVAPGSAGIADPSHYPTPISVAGKVAIVNLLANGQTLATVNPFPGFTGEVRRAIGDVNGDGTPDVVYAMGPGTGPHVKVVDGKTGAIIAGFDAFDPAFLGGVFVALADVNGDGILDVIAGAGPGGSPHVKVIDGTKLNLVEANGEIASTALIASFYAYDPGFSGGVTVAGADLNGDGHSDIITGAGPGGSPHVKAIDGTMLGNLSSNSQIANSALLAAFFAYDPSFNGGVFVAAADVNHDGTPDIITGAGVGGSPHVKVIDGTHLHALQANSEIAAGALIGQFFAYDPRFAGGVRVDALDVNGNGRADIVTGAGPGGGPEVKVVDATKLGQLQNNAEIAASALLDDFMVQTSFFPSRPAVKPADPSPSGAAKSGSAAQNGLSHVSEDRVGVKPIDGSNIADLQPKQETFDTEFLDSLFLYSPAFAETFGSRR